MNTPSRSTSLWDIKINLICWAAYNVELSPAQRKYKKTNSVSLRLVSCFNAVSFPARTRLSFFVCVLAGCCVYFKKTLWFFIKQIYWCNLKGQISFSYNISFRFIMFCNFFVTVGARLWLGKYRVPFVYANAFYAFKKKYGEILCFLDKKHEMNIIRLILIMCLWEGCSRWLFF